MVKCHIQDDKPACAHLQRWIVGLCSGVQNKYERDKSHTHGRNPSQDGDTFLIISQLVPGLLVSLNDNQFPRKYGHLLIIRFFFTNVSGSIPASLTQWLQHVLHESQRHCRISSRGNFYLFAVEVGTVEANSLFGSLIGIRCNPHLLLI